MSISKAKRIFIFSNIILSSIVILVLCGVFSLPVQHADAVIAEGDTDSSEIDFSQNREIGYSPEKFMASLDADINITEKKEPRKSTENAQEKIRHAKEKAQQELKRSLKLSGTWVSENPDESIAVIKWKDEGEGLYRSGEIIENSDGVKLVDIFYDFVEVEKDTMIFTLDIDISDSTPADSLQTKTDKNKRNILTSQQARHSRKYSKTDPLEIKKYAPNKYRISRKDIQPYFEHPEKLWAEMNLSPQMENGEPTKGYIINGMKKDALLRKFGLRQGDVILQINGQPPINIMNVISGPSVGALHIEYLRGGNRKALHITIRD